MRAERNEELVLQLTCGGSDTDMPVNVFWEADGCGELLDAREQVLHGTGPHVVRQRLRANGSSGTVVCTVGQGAKSQEQLFRIVSSE